jgi:hypothetical protein
LLIAELEVLTWAVVEAVLVIIQAHALEIRDGKLLQPEAHVGSAVLCPP